MPTKIESEITGTKLTVTVKYCLFYTLPTAYLEYALDNFLVIILVISMFLVFLI